MCNVNIDLKDSNTFATCKGCERLVCRNEKCAEWISSIGIWECATCHSNRVIQQKAGEWLLQQLNVRIKSPGPVNLKKDSIFGLNEADDSRSTTSSISSNQRVKVREFIEELLSSMLNGPLDDVSVGQLCKNENYLPLWEGYHDSPGDKHIELKRMVQNIIEEVLKIPDLLNYSGYPDRREEPLPFFDPKKYEQLLATAVLNKVVDSYRNDKNFLDNSSGVHSDSEFDSNHNLTGKKSVKNENIKPMSLTIDELNENLARSKNELNSYNQRESDTDESYLSDYIQKHTVPLPDLSDSTSTAEEDNQSVKSNGTDGTWEENWLFKKRQLKTADTSIAMLVPSPTEEVRALIGDKNADEISDLSEAGSDVEDYESDSLSKNQTESSTKNSTDDMLHPDSLISLNSIPYNEPLLSEAKNNLLLMQGDYEYNKTSGDSGNGVDDLISIESSDAVPLIIEPIICQHKLVVVEENNNIVTDDAKTLNEINLYDTALAENEDNSVYPVAAARCLPSTEERPQPVQRKSETQILQAQAEDIKPVNEDPGEDNLIPGSIAEREHLKWLNAAPIPNNPYSADALQRRLSETERKSKLIDVGNASPEKTEDYNKIENSNTTQERSIQAVLGAGQNDYKRYGRDYYINEAKKASGARKKLSDFSSLSHSTDDEKVSRLNPFSTNSYIMDKFLSDDNSVRKAHTLRPTKRPASLDLELRKEDVEIPSSILTQFEKEMVHNNFKRDSFRARNATRQFVLNPIFDEGDEATPPTIKSPTKSRSTPLIDNEKTRSEDRNLSVETVFTDLNTLRRSGSVRSNNERQRSFLFAKRTSSFRSNQDRQI